MDSATSRVKLMELIILLPKKLQYEFILVDNTDRLFDEASTILKIDKEKIKKTVLKTVNTKKYKNSRQVLNKKYNFSGRIFGLATSPIILNCGECPSWKTLCFTYLHEVGHLLGLKSKKGKVYSEEMADKIAIHYFRKIYIGKNEILRSKGLLE